MTTRTDHRDIEITTPSDRHSDVDLTLIDDNTRTLPPRPVREGGFEGAADRAANALKPLWRDRRISGGSALGVVALWGVAAGRWTPRSPLTSSQAIWSIVISLAVGGVAGLVLRSRLAMFAAPVTFVIVFELTRLGTDGPTVDGIEVSTYGFLALIVGRGFHALISLLPMVFGGAIGAGVGRYLVRPASEVRTRLPRWLVVRRVTAVIAALGLVAFTVVLARPASTEPIVDANGNAVSGSIAELRTIDVGGHDLHLMIRGYSVDNPVLLFVAGGPGGSELGAMRNHLPELEEHFTVVTWDQRGSGRSYDELDPTASYTLSGAVDDTVGVTNYLRNRFGQDRIYLLGQSWGSTLGVLAVQQEPDLYQAFIGTGQMVSQLETDTIFYNDTLDWATSTGDTGLVDELTAIGPPPYQRMLDYETALSSEHEVYPYDHADNSEGEGGFSENFLVREYTLIDQVHLLGAFMDTFSVLYPQLQGIDFRRSATDFEIPMFFVQGRNEAGGRADVFADWYPMVNAPIKDLTTLDTSGHRPLFEQPEQFVAYMTDTVLARTDSAG